ncbi:MAG: HD domain-containing phosphohydrolase [Huintestinicola sp.]|uniref:HD domain-containing phosphohydrolase n=1 Tax=Huintestinicola sp. TaxID=2981661 RepID=UPI003F00666A
MLQRSRKILIISDVEDIGQSISKILGPGYEFFLSPADEPVFTIGGRTLPDVLVLDIAAPDLRAEIARTIHNDERISALDVICLMNEDEDDEKTKRFVSDLFTIVNRSEDFHEVAEKIKSIFDEINGGTDNTDDEKSDDEILAESQSCLNNMSYQLIKAISLLAEVKDPCFRGHSRRSASLAKEILKRMGGTEEEQMRIYYAALVHDIGMVAIPDHIVGKRASLSEEEFNDLRQHTIIGSKIFSGVTQIPEINQGIRWHHERYDGTGYPDGLSGEDIPLAARIIAAADAYDSMTSEMVYRSSMGQQQVREEFIKGSGTQFDPEIAKIILSIIYDDKNFERRQISKNDWKILLVDDDPMILKMAEYILSRYKQYKILQASSGRAALKILREETDIDLILLDVEMPLMDGIETLIRIRSDELTRSLPVIFVTADSSRETLSKALKFGISGYIAKPFTPTFFVKKINEILNKNI